MKKQKPYGKAKRQSASELPKWRRRALTLFSELTAELETEDLTIYGLFSLLLSRCHKAHKNGDIRFELPRIYQFAAWCFRGADEDVSNAAGVSFYEHLADEPATREAIPQWLEPDIFEAAPFAWRMSEEEFQRLQKRYEARS